MLSIVIVCIILYSLVLLVSLSQIYLILKDCKFQKANSLQFQFMALITLFLIFRIAFWFLTEKAAKRNVLIFAINRLAILSFFTSFTLLLFFWMELYHGLISSFNLTRLSSLKKPFIILNILLYIYQIICIIMFAVSTEKIDNKNTFYNVNVLLIAGFSGLVSISFLIYGLLLYRKLRDSWGRKTQRAPLFRMLGVTIVYTVSFILRFAFFLYRPITDKLMNENIYLIFAYLLPELSAATIQIFTMRVKVKKVVRIDHQLEIQMLSEESD
ncbi:tobamovirus multiplication protein 1-like isoform x1 [Anaeramoeba flamelloides]|uniref:Tobamovirus multiplication protein 1-like isoform x1 n=1 Tax=Anaeramoeba flamelloides TaxID=1746091 RepID=A0ABQ8Z564_9EUKA|nr:tobamovirus multiplication protein 1-like isoform x1 [Anaeramoeba flamelloides]